MASESASSSTYSENASFSSVENEANRSSNAKKRRKKSFLWNPNISFSSRRKWRTKKSKSAADDHESMTRRTQFDYSAPVLHGSESNHEGKPDDTSTEHGFSPIEDSCDLDSSDNFGESTFNNDSEDSSSSDYDGYLSSSDDSFKISDEEEEEEECLLESQAE